MRLRGIGLFLENEILARMVEAETQKNHKNTEVQVGLEARVGPGVPVGDGRGAGTQSLRMRILALGIKVRNGGTKGEVIETERETEQETVQGSISTQKITETRIREITTTDVTIGTGAQDDLKSPTQTTTNHILYQI